MRIPAPNYTQTPNDLFDHWLPLLKESELKVLLVIMRKTFGWHKIRDAISISQLMKMTGLARETVVDAARTLQQNGIVKREVVGPPGKQDTIYELIISEDSNNSDQSEIPTPPVRFTQGGKSDPQKKPFPKETTQKKQQQKPAAVPLKKEEEKRLEIYPCLKDVDIPFHVKKQLTKKWDLERVVHALKWIEQNKKPLAKGLAAALTWACNVQPEFEILKEDLQKKNKEYAQKYEGMKNGATYIGCNNKFVEIVYGGCQKEPFCLTYETKGFIDQFTSALRKNNFKILEA